MVEDEFFFNHHPEQTGIWFKYNGWRYKEYYDVKLYDGTVVSKCYPNGSGFHGEGQRVADTDVEFLRLVDYSESYFYNNISKEEAVRIMLGRYEALMIPKKQTNPDGTVEYMPTLKSQEDT